jgi:CheY-like chemotaxis protein
MFARQLSTLGCRIILKDDGDQLVPTVAACAKEGDPVAVVLLDITMKRTHGDVACQQLRAASFTCPVIAVTGEQDSGHLSRIGFDAVLTKPIGQAALVSAVRHWLAVSSSMVA